MNHTTPHAPDSIAVLRARQLEATKRRVLAELRDYGIAQTIMQYRAEPFGSGEVDVKAVQAKEQDGLPVVLQHPIEAAHYDLADLVERFSLDVLAHLHPGFPGEAGGSGSVTIHTDAGTVRIEHTDIETNEISSDKTF